MDCVKIGKLINDLRKQKGMTQKELADILCVTDKAVSKWERGMGCPDASLWSELSEVLGVDIKKMLDGELYPNETDKGNINKIKFYVCESCGNIITSTSKCDLSCCGRKLLQLQIHQTTQDHYLDVELVESNYYIKSEHEMTKEHYIQFIAFVTDASVWINRLYPEQNVETFFPASFYKGTIYMYCNHHGLMRQTVSKKELRPKA